MGYAIGTVTRVGGGNVDCHYQLLEVIKNLAEANGWTTLRYDSAADNREWIGKSLGFSGTEEIFIGIRTYQSVAGDYYNLLLGTFTGYIPSNSFDSQPGAQYSGVPAHNNAITYYMNMNPQRLAFMLKVGTPVYTHGYIGKFLPYARPSEYPNPLMCAGSFDGAELKRFSDVTQVFPYHGAGVTTQSRLTIRRPDGSWYAPANWPFSQGNSSPTTAENLLGGIAATQVPINGVYQGEAIIMCDMVSAHVTTGNIWGELDGVLFVSGFNNAVENVVQMGGSSTVDQNGMSVLQAVTAIKSVGGKAYVMGQNINRTTWRDYVALEM